MFQIDRSYIDNISLESIQGHVWDIRSDNKDNPSLPKIENYKISEKEFEEYLEKKQKFEDFKDSWKRYRFLILTISFVIPVDLYSMYSKDNSLAIWAYVTGFLLSLLIYSIYLIIETIKSQKFRNNPCETFIKALLSWENNQHS